MKKIFGLIIICLFSVMFIGCKSETLEKIAIVQYATHDSLDTIKNACVAELEALGYKDGENVEIIYKNCNGDGSTISQVLKSLENKDISVIVAITTPVAAEAVKYSETTPVVFSAVSDPSEILKSGKEITGTSDAIQVSLIIDFIEKTLKVNNKDLKKIGFIYNPSEANSVSNLAKINNYLKNKDFSLEAKAISKASEIEMVASALTEKVDAIFVTDDNTVASAMSVLASVGLEKNIPIFTGADSMVNDGGLATIGINYEDLGKETAKMVGRILKGEKASEIEYKVFDSNLKLFVNKNTLETLRLKLPLYDGEVVYLGE